MKQNKTLCSNASYTKRQVIWQPMGVNYSGRSWSLAMWRNLVRIPNEGGVHI